MLGERIRWLSGLPITLVLIACSASDISPSSSAVTELTTQSPSPTAVAPPVTEVPPLPTNCGDTSEVVASRVLACLDEGNGAVSSNEVALVYHLDPRLSKAAQSEITGIAEWALPYYNGYFTRLKRSAKMHIIVPLDSKWCGEQVAEFDYGNPTAEATANSYLCGQDGGANAGHADSPSTAFVVVRPDASLVASLQTGDGGEKARFYYSLVAAEMGHASRGLMMEAFTGELGGQPYWPIWAQYMANELMRFAADVKLGISQKSAIEDRIWWMCERKLTWRSDYGDKRLQSWESGGGIYGCPGGPDDQTNMDTPNHYNMAYMAGEFFTLTKGYDWMLQVFMQQPLKSRRGDGTADLNAAAASLGWADWDALESDLNTYMWERLVGFGANIPEK